MEFPFAKSVQKHLGHSLLNLKPIQGGTNSRTYEAICQNSPCIIRSEPGDGFQLRRAYRAQMMAQGLGVKVPRVLCHNLDSNETDHWMIEEKVIGIHFYPEEMDDNLSPKACRELGQQFSRMHQLSIDKFGLLAPYPYENYADWKMKNPEEIQRFESNSLPLCSTFIDFISQKKDQIRKAHMVVGLTPVCVEKLELLCDQLVYRDEPRFCGGDTCGSNILTYQGNVMALIDMEWACGSDPAMGIAAWSAWNSKGKYLDYFLEGYQPKDEFALKNRILIYELLEDVSTILSYYDIGNSRELDRTTAKLENKIGNVKIS